jgi:ribosome biogenesis GTPase A
MRLAKNVVYPIPKNKTIIYIFQPPNPNMRVKFNFSSRLTGKSRKPSTTNNHRVAFTKQASEVIKTSDIILEIIDARFIDKTRNLKLEEEAKNAGKKIIYVLNKADLIEVKDLKMNYDLASLKPYVLFSTKSKIGRARLREMISIETKKTEFKKARVGVIGYPNTGKSSVINVLSGGKNAGTSSQSGFTRNIQKVRLSKNTIILDTPGVISSGEENSREPQIVKKQIETSVKNYEKVRYPDFVVNDLMNEHPGVLDKFYNVNSEGDTDTLLDLLGKKWNFLKKKGVIDKDRTARIILRDWQKGDIKVSLKKPVKENENQ